MFHKNSILGRGEELFEDSADFLLAKEKVKNRTFPPKFFKLAKNRFCSIEGSDKLPGAEKGQRVNVIWVGKAKQDIHLDKGVKIYDLEEIRLHEIDGN